jgi:threonylcarbamoyladenosine tRNA methylthiotransferase MtaB
VFTYSERPNTLAAEMREVVPVNLRHERNKKLRNLSYLKMKAHTGKHTGELRKVLFESSSKNGMMEGYTDNYIKINTFFKPEWVNQIVDWKI